MMNDAEYEIHIDPEFRDLVYPLSARAYHALEESMLHDGCNTSIKVWNHQVLDGLSKFEICVQHDLTFTIEKKHFKRRRDALAWICEQQLQRNDLPPQMRRYLIGMMYETQKPTSGRGRVPNGQYPGNQKAKRAKLLNRLSAKNHVTTYTIQRYAGFARAINGIKRQSPELAQVILSGDYGITHEKAIQLSHQTKNELLEYYKNLEKGQELKEKELPLATSFSSSGKPVPSVKDTPAYDPDAEINGLALTIPSWCSSMERVRNTIDPEIVSESAKSRLRSGLTLLTNEVEKVVQFVS